MTIVLTNVRAAGMPVTAQTEAGRQSIDVDELLSKGATPMIACDAGMTHSAGCLRYTTDGPEPEGWERVADPWGRFSRFTGDVLMLHLCPSCVRGGRGEEVPNARAAEVRGGRVTPEMRMAAAAAGIEEGHDGQTG